MQQMIDQENVPPSNNKPRPGFTKFFRVQEERDGALAIGRAVVLLTLPGGRPTSWRPRVV